MGALNKEKCAKKFDYLFTIFEKYEKYSLIFSYKHLLGF